MRDALLSLLIVASVCWPEQAATQGNRVGGRLSFNPAVAGPVDAVIEIYGEGHDVPIHEIRVDRSSPFRFGATISDRQDLRIRVVISDPAGWVSSQREYTKPACCDFNRQIIIKLPRDLYVEFRDQAIRLVDTDPDRAYQSFLVAEELAQSPVQRLEVLRQRGLLLGTQGRRSEQQSELAKFYEDASAFDVGPVKTQVYWRERLDGFLEWTEFSDLQMPERDFGRILADPSHAEQRPSWDKFIEQFRLAYPDTDLHLAAASPEDLTEQLRHVMAKIQGSN